MKRADFTRQQKSTWGHFRKKEKTKKSRLTLVHPVWSFTDAKRQAFMTWFEQVCFPSLAAVWGARLWQKRSSRWSKAARKGHCKSTIFMSCSSHSLDCQFSVDVTSETYLIYPMRNVSFRALKISESFAAYSNGANSVMWIQPKCLHR